MNSHDRRKQLRKFFRRVIAGKSESLTYKDTDVYCRWARELPVKKRKEIIATLLENVRGGHNARHGVAGTVDNCVKWMTPAQRLLAIHCTLHPTRGGAPLNTSFRYGVGNSVTSIANEVVRFMLTGEEPDQLPSLDAYPMLTTDA
jgi:hypothetical protein